METQKQEMLKHNNYLVELSGTGRQPQFSGNLSIGALKAVSHWDYKELEHYLIPTEDL